MLRFAVKYIVRSLDLEDPLEKEMATHPSILAWEIPWREELVGYSTQGCKIFRHDLTTKHTHTYVLCISEMI